MYCRSLVELFIIILPAVANSSVKAVLGSTNLLANIRMAGSLTRIKYVRYNI